MPKHLRAVPKQPERPRTSSARTRLPEIGDREVRVLHELVQDEGLATVAGWIGVSQVTLLRVLAGLFDTCRLAQRNRVRAFFAEAQA